MPVNKANLVRLMCMARLTLSGLHRKSGVSIVALRGIMLGRTKKVQHDTIGKIADALGVDCMELVDMG